MVIPPFPCYNRPMKDLMNHIPEFRSRLLNRYAVRKRDLPWRKSPTPYHVWISEIMLQQTRVEAVLFYYERFLTAFPDIRTLAEADQDAVLKLWEGLGYYSRARNIHKAAGIIVRDFDGEFPDTPERIRSLPGIGEYTAGAISSICFDLPVPAVDGNLIRVGARLTAYDGETKNAAGKRYFNELWQTLIDPAAPGDFNQAIMDLGATICLPNGIPKCEDCPVADFCKAKELDRVTGFPKKTEKAPRRVEKKTVLLPVSEGCFAVRRRPPTGLLAGLWEFPMLEGRLSQKNVREWLTASGLRAIRIRKGPSSKHIFSHIEWHMTSWIIQLEHLPVVTEIRDTDEDGIAAWQWIDEKRLKDYAIPGAFHPYRNALCENLNLQERPAEHTSG